MRSLTSAGARYFHQLEELLGQSRFEVIPVEILPHCKAVPLGVMARGIMKSVLDADGLEALFRKHAPEQYTLQLTVDALVNLLIQVPPARERRCTLPTLPTRPRGHQRSPPVTRQSTASSGA